MRKTNGPSTTLSYIHTSRHYIQIQSLNAFRRNHNLLNLNTTYFSRIAITDPCDITLLSSVWVEVFLLNLLKSLRQSSPISKIFTPCQSVRNSAKYILSFRKSPACYPITRNISQTMHCANENSGNRALFHKEEENKTIKFYVQRRINIFLQIDLDSMRARDNLSLILIDLILTCTSKLYLLIKKMFTLFFLIDHSCDDIIHKIFNFDARI